MFNLALIVEDVFWNARFFFIDPSRNSQTRENMQQEESPAQMTAPIEPR